MASRGIPQDLVVEILKRVPVKSLLRFKATSKGWYALISSPNFIKSHLASSPDRVLIIDRYQLREALLVPDCDDESRAVYLNTRGAESANLYTDGVEPYLDFYFYYNGIVSCDGIVCLFGGSHEDRLPVITLWNPATKKLKNLPTFDFDDEPRHEYDRLGYWLGVGGWDWYVGFGFDSKTDDYKVVVIINSWPVKYPAVLVYGLKTNSWRVIDSAAPPPIFNSDTTPSYTQGMCYWIAPDCNIVSFDLEEEVFQVRPAPPPKLPFESGKQIKLASSNESLVLMYYSFDSPIEVWTTKKDLLKIGGNCWSLRYIMEPPAQFYAPSLQPLGFWKNCLLFFPELPVYGRIVYDTECCLYDPGTGDIRNLQFPGKVNDQMMLTSSYKETLVSLA